MTLAEAQSIHRKILVICEGKHESGGALKNLIQRIRPDTQASEFVFDLWKNPRNPGRHFRSTGKGDGVFKKFVASVIEAQREGFDAVIGLIDCDGDRSRIRSVDQAQADDRVSFPRAFGVAIETFDAWFLADEVALSDCFGMMISTQPDPESIEDAKSVLIDLRDRGQCSDSLADCYAKLANDANLELVERRCPKGFAVWRKRVSSM